VDRNQRPHLLTAKLGRHVWPFFVGGRSMCQSRHPQSQNSARHVADKMGYPPKTLPWTDKFCHFVRFETPSAQAQSKHLRGCIMQLTIIGCRDQLTVIPAKAGTQRMDVGLHQSTPDAPPDDDRGDCSLTDHWIPAFAGMTSVRQDDVERFPPLGPQPFALNHPALIQIHQFSLCNSQFAICNSPSHSW
jgi:hypothetical protein